MPTVASAARIKGAGMGQYVIRSISGSNLIGFLIVVFEI